METTSLSAVQAPVTVESNSNAEMMKNITKAKLARKALIDPSFAGELVRLEASGVYNAKGDVVQAVSSSLGDA